MLLAGDVLANIPSCTLFGIDALPVWVEVEVAAGLPGYHVVGLPTPSVREGGVRIRAALAQVGHDLPMKKVTVNLAPADLRKSGSAFDLPIAIGVLVADEVVPIDALEGLLMLGELGLDGSLRAARGVLAAAMLVRERGLRGIVVPAASAAEAALVEGIEVHAAEHLAEVVAALAGTGALRRVTERDVELVAVPSPLGDMSEVRGQAMARAAVEIAVAGGHNLLLAGPPGIGKTMLARRVPSILPPLRHDEALETTKIYSALGMTAGLMKHRPFRAPHHTVSTSALLGGGAVPKPGEISLAHNGVLFLDELPEFSRASVEALRQPLEDREITIGRVQGTVRLPASFLLVASANPCPCGWAGSGARACTCSPSAIERYRSRMSGPLLDRIDLQVFVRAVSLIDLRREAASENSDTIRTRVIEARARQAHRLAPWGFRTNAEMSTRAMRATCRLPVAAEDTLTRLHQIRRGMTGRAVDRMIKVARTIADLLGQDDIDAGCIAEAAAYRALEQDPTATIPMMPIATH